MTLDTPIDGLEKDPERYVEILPTLIEMMIGEYRTMPRRNMLHQLQRKVKAGDTGAEARSLIAAGLKRAVGESEVKPGHRSSASGFSPPVCSAGSSQVARQE